MAAFSGTPEITFLAHYPHGFPESSRCTMSVTFPPSSWPWDTLSNKICTSSLAERDSSPYFYLTWCLVLALEIMATTYICIPVFFFVSLSEGIFSMIFRECGKNGERQRERNIHQFPPALAWTRARDPACKVHALEQNQTQDNLSIH